MSIKCLLVAISNYPGVPSCNSIPCTNDLIAMKNALISGLHIDETDMCLLGGSGLVYLNEYEESISLISSGMEQDDVLIVYFSCHGGIGKIAFSNKIVDLNYVLDKVKETPSKHIIIFLDCCHSGSFEIGSYAQLEVGKMIHDFAGCGCSIMASCGSSETSGFHPMTKISLFTSFLCEALISRIQNWHGKKSVEMIYKSVCRSFDVWNSTHINHIQHPVFRSNMGGTFFFDVEPYQPYEIEQVYEECEEYIIYSVEPLHNSKAKRYAIKVILRLPHTLEQIAKIADEIVHKALYYEVYKSERLKKQYTGKLANIVWCYFGNDEDDIVNGTYEYHSTWVDETQDKAWWYRDSNNVQICNGVYFECNSSYEIIKKLQISTIPKEELIKLTKECTRRIISTAEKFISFFREYCNKSINEDQLIQSVASINRELSKWYFMQSDLPIPPIELKEWSDANESVACAIHDLSLFYDEKNLKMWDSEKRRYLTHDAIERYEKALEELYKIETEQDM